MNKTLIAKNLRALAEELEGVATWPSFKASFKRRKVGSFIASIILASRKDDYIKTLERQRPDLDPEEISEELISLQNPKKEKMALYWICKENLELPKDLEILNQVYSVLEKTHKDFQSYQSPKEVLESKEEKIQKHVGKSGFNPNSEPAFSNPVKLEKGIVIYEVKDSKEGQLATRRAIDASWGLDATPWCLAARKNPNQFLEEYGDFWWGLSRQEKDEIDKELLKGAWRMWRHYSESPKRIAFQNGKLLAFFADNVWWDKQNYNGSFYNLIGVYDPLEEELKRKKNLAISSNTPAEVLRELANDEDKKVRMNVAENPNTPEDALRKLAKDKDGMVRLLVAENPNTPEDVIINFLRGLAKDENREIREKITRDFNTSAKILRELTKDKNVSVRRNIAYNSNAPEDALMELAKDKSKQVRRNVAQNKNTPEDTLRELAKDENKFVRYNVAYNPNTPEDALMELAKDKNGMVRMFVAQNRNAPIKALRELAKDEDKYVRRNVATNSNTPIEVLRELAKDENVTVRIFVIYNSNTPAEVLRELAKDKSKQVRWNVARYTTTPEDILRELTKDKEEDVKRTAENTLERLHFI